MADGPKELGCPSDWEKVKDTAKGGGDGKTKSAARTAARNDVYKAAISDLQLLFTKYKCPKDCQLVIDFRLKEIKLDKAEIAGLVKYHCSGTVDWSARVRCTGQTLEHNDQQDIDDQDLDCKESAEGWGTATGQGEDADEDTATRKALESLQGALDLAIEGELEEPDPSGITLRRKVRCDPDCPEQRIKIRADCPTVKCTAPAEENGNYKCKAERKWYILVECK